MRIECGGSYSSNFTHTPHTQLGHLKYIPVRWAYDWINRCLSNTKITGLWICWNPISSCIQIYIFIYSTSTYMCGCVRSVLADENTIESCFFLSNCSHISTLLEHWRCVLCVFCARARSRCKHRADLPQNADTRVYVVWNRVIYVYITLTATGT